MSGPVLALAELRAGRLAPVWAEVLACAREIAAHRSCAVRVAALGRGSDSAAAEIAAAAGVDVVAVRGAGLEPFTAEAHLAALAELVEQERPAVVCLAHSSQGLELAPRLAARWSAAYIAGVEAVAPEGERLVLARAVHGGRVMLELEPRTETSVITAQPGAFAAPAGASTPGSVERRETAAAPGRTRALELERVHDGAEAITEAEVVVAAGRGVGGPQGLALVEALTRLFPRAAVAGSRPVCDAGWLPYARQVGMTGATVAPRLYLACGISGARQHTVGMRGAELVVAINSDPEAAIHQLADVSVIELLERFLPLLVEEYERSRGG